MTPTKPGRYVWPYAGKERFARAPTDKSSRLITRRAKRNTEPLPKVRRFRKSVSINFDDATYREVVHIARAQNNYLGDVVRELVKLGLEHVDGVKR